MVFQGTPCDLITGEERRHASQYNTLVDNNEESEKPEAESFLIEEPELTPSKHVACTVEMTSLNELCESKVLLFLVQICQKKYFNKKCCRAFL